MPPVEVVQLADPVEFLERAASSRTRHATT
jgi:hypothetical protein